MALKAVANVSCTISHSAGSTTSGGAFVITTPPSVKVFADAAPLTPLGAYNGSIAITFSGGNSSETFGGTGVITPGTVYGTATISPTATKVSAETGKVIRVEDGATFTTLFGTFVPSAPPNTPVPDTPLLPTNIEISDAGQTKVVAE